MEAEQPREIKDSGFKILLDNHELFAEFMRDFVPLDIFKDLRAEDIEDVSGRYPSLEHDEIESDMVKKIRLHEPDTPPLFVIATIEHESQVNFRESFKVLRYMVEIWYNYEEEEDARTNEGESGGRKRPSRAKGFKYPPILAIALFDGPGTWNAEKNFMKKVWMNDVFAPYIPSFEYIVVDINRYDRDALVKFGDALSFVLLLDKVRREQDLPLLRDLPPGFMEFMSRLPDALKDLIIKVFRAFLEKAKIPRETIDDITYQIKERRGGGMFEHVEIDFQEIIRREKEPLEQELKRKEQEMQRKEQEMQHKQQTTMANLRALGLSDEQIMQAMGL
ncbi:MAG: Rpn family recombination-promoting nuclease/putative transposase [Treponema sp.]|jgi:hypothetical protein|nr:Rpn family recombination-promoting nuclease/putative transposase [Treponema sp.]